MDTQTLETFTTDQLREALANAWSTTAADEIRAELARRADPRGPMRQITHIATEGRPYYCSICGPCDADHFHV